MPEQHLHVDEAHTCDASVSALPVCEVKKLVQQSHYYLHPLHQVQTAPCRLTPSLLQLRGCSDDCSSGRSRATQCSAGKSKRSAGNAWESFMRGAGLKSMDSYVDSMDSPAAPRRTGKPLSEKDEAIRKQESTFLNIWTQQAFFLLAGAFTLVLLVALLSVSGQTGTAPTDPRCTLPWC